MPHSVTQYQSFFEKSGPIPHSSNFSILYSVILYQSTIVSMNPSFQELISINHSSSQKLTSIPTVDMNSQFQYSLSVLHSPIPKSKINHNSTRDYQSPIPLAGINPYSTSQYQSLNPVFNINPQFQ